MEDGWQPIETIPTKGTAVLVYVPMWDQPIRIGFYSSGKVWADYEETPEDAQPTHWMPLPKAPA